MPKKIITSIFCNEKKKFTLLLSLCLLLLSSMLTNNVVYGQAQEIGSFPTMEGGFENTTVAGQTATTVSTGVQLTAYTGANTTNSNQFIYNSTVRTGAKSLQWITASTSGVLFTPTAASTSIANTASYVVQFYCWKINTSSARGFTVSIGPDGTTGLGGTSTTATLGVNSIASVTWTKTSVVVSSGTSAASPRYGLVRMVPNGGSFATPGYLLDDYVVYPGTSVDNIAADNATGPSISNPTSTTLDVNWVTPVTGAGNGVDGGGYVVVRYTADPSAQPAPNVNGIYGVGNTIGTGNSFTDNDGGAGLAANTYYYYRV